jgi:glycosyltransferase involved in cell wall biosynthesis
MAAGAVEFLGEVEDPSGLLRDADVFVLASSAEGMSNALLEAMAAGCACVATFGGGNVDLLGPEHAAAPPAGTYLRGSAGLIVPAGDVAALGAALRDLAADPTLRRHLGQAAYLRCLQAYAIADVARTYLDLYRALRVRAS